MKFIGAFLAFMTLFTVSAMSAPSNPPTLLQQEVQSTVKIETADGVGTGFIVQGPKGELLVLTAGHVVGGSKTINIIFADKSTTLGHVAAIDGDNDWAIVVPKQLPVGYTGSAVNCAAPELGNPVTVIGYPLDVGLVVSPGIVASVDTTSNVHLGYNYMVSASVQHGNSGGPVFDGAGKVVGMILAKVDMVDGWAPGLALPASTFCPE